MSAPQVLSAPLRVLVVDDEPGVLSSLKMALSVEGYQVDVAGDGVIAREKLATESYQAALLDVGLPGESGTDLLAFIKTAEPDVVCLMMSGEASIDIAVEATRRGAVDFLEKPVSTDRLLLSLKNGLRLLDAERTATELSEATGELKELRGDSARMVALRDLVARAARSAASVLLSGERGTGKELVARAIHDASPRAKGPLEKLNCAAVPENLIESELFGHEPGAFTGATKRRAGRFERAHKGTLFLDEVGDMPLSMQAKLLRVLQEQEIERVGGGPIVNVDVRVVAATNKDLVEECREGRFREDLFDRLNVIPIQLPPLRERTSDIEALALHFLKWAQKRNDRKSAQLAPEALKLISKQSFPGNVRELRNLIERLVILSPEDVITAAFVESCLGRGAPGPAALYRPGTSFKELSEAAEAAILTEALAAHDGQMAATARALGLERSHLYKKAKALGLRAASGDDAT